jgi:hypothetical protein
MPVITEEPIKMNKLLSFKYLQPDEKKQIGIENNNDFNIK